MLVTTKRDFLAPIDSAASFLVRSPLAQLKTTFWVPGLSPLVMKMLVALNFFFNAELTYFLQPFHVIPVNCATYAVGFASSLSAAKAKPRLRVKTPIDAISSFFIFFIEP